MGAAAVSCLLWQETDVSPVVKAPVSFHDAFGGNERVDVLRVTGKLGGQSLFALSESWFEKGVAVACHDDVLSAFMVFRARYHLYAFFVYRETVYYGIGLVLTGEHALYE